VRAFHLGDDFHCADFWRAGDGAAGESRGQNVDGSLPISQTPNDGRDQMMDRGESLETAKLWHLHRARHAYFRKIVAQKIDDHDILGAILAALGQRERLKRVENGIGETAPRALDRPGFDTVALDFQKSFGRSRGDGEIFMREIGRKWGRIEHAQTAVEAEMIEAVWHGGFEPLRHIGLKNIAGEDALDDFADHPLISLPA